MRELPDRPPPAQPGQVPNSSLLDPEDAESRRRAAHHLLLRLAGRLPDTVLTRAREWLADGRLSDVGALVTDAALQLDLALPAEDGDLLGQLVASDGDDPIRVRHLPTGPVALRPPYRFLPVAPTGVSGASPGADRAAVAAAAAVPAVAALWRAWRVDQRPGHAPGPRRVYVVVARRGVDLPRLAVAVQGRLSAAGERSPQVEVIAVGDRVPAYQRLARSAGRCLWVRPRGAVA